jgi:hypothetical protein
MLDESDNAFHSLISNHPLNAKPTDKGPRPTAFRGQANTHQGARGVPEVIEDVHKGHEILGTDPKQFAGMGPAQRLNAHRDAEMLGYHANKHKYMRRHSV